MNSFKLLLSCTFALVCVLPLLNLQARPISSPNGQTVEVNERADHKPSLAARCAQRITGQSFDLEVIEIGFMINRLLSKASRTLPPDEPYATGWTAKTWIGNSDISSNEQRSLSFSLPFVGPLPIRFEHTSGLKIHISRKAPSIAFIHFDFPSSRIDAFKANHKTQDVTSRKFSIQLHVREDASAEKQQVLDIDGHHREVLTAAELVHVITELVSSVTEAESLQGLQSTPR